MSEVRLDTTAFRDGLNTADEVMRSICTDAACVLPKGHEGPHRIEVSLAEACELVKDGHGDKINFV